MFKYMQISENHHEVKSSQIFSMSVTVNNVIF